MAYHSKIPSNSFSRHLNMLLVKIRKYSFNFHDNNNHALRNKDIYVLHDLVWERYLHVNLILLEICYIIN
jgi:hypothetical protein